MLMPMLLYVFFGATEVDVEFVEVFQECAERCSFGHLGEGIDVFRETFASVAEFAVRSGYLSVRIVDITGEKDACVHLTPVHAHLLAILAAGIEIRHFVCAEDIVHILSQLCLQRRHDGEFLSDKDFRQQFLRSGEDHGLFAEVLKICAFGQELRHIADLMACFARELFAGAGDDGCSHKDGDVRQVRDELFHQSQVLRAVIFRRHMNLQKSDVDIAQIVIVSFGRIANEEFALRVVVLQPVFERRADKSASYNSNINHSFSHFIKKACKDTTFFSYMQAREE